MAMTGARNLQNSPHVARAMSPKQESTVGFTDLCTPWFWKKHINKKNEEGRGRGGRG